MRRIYEIFDNKHKEEYTGSILRLLPEWFGLESGIKNYISESKESMFYVSEYNGLMEGFISVKFHNELSAEIISMGVKKEYHGNGIGKALVTTVEKALRRQGVKLLQVKTLGPSEECEYYSKTRSFYESIGFFSLEENFEIWGMKNPCLIMIKVLSA